MIDPTPRWRYRFENFERALASLDRAVKLTRAGKIGEVERAGLLQLFNLAWDLVWKVLREYIEVEGGIIVQPVTPHSTVRAAMEAGMIIDRQDWMDALETRNKIAHIYSLDMANELLPLVTDRFVPMMIRFAGQLRARVR